MKKKSDKLEPIPTISKSEASYEKLMLEMMARLVAETKDNNHLIKEHFSQRSPSPCPELKDCTNIVSRDMHTTITTDFSRSPKKNDPIIEVEETPSGHNLRPIKLKTSASTAKLNMDFGMAQQSSMEKLLKDLTKRLETSEQINKKLLNRLQNLENETKPVLIQSKKQLKTDDISLIEKALGDKVQNQSSQKRSYVILSEILPYSDRREMKVKFKISDLLRKDPNAKLDVRAQASEWLGMVYRATASICWNMLLNNYLNFEEVKILFTENIVFNFIEFMNELKVMGKREEREELTAIINEKSVDVLDFLCKQYPQTKIEAPNISLRSILPQIDNQGRIKYDLVARSGIAFTYSPDGDYTQQIMKMINFMIDKTNDDYDNFFSFMRTTFEEVYLPVHKRRPLDGSPDAPTRDLIHDDLIYKDKVKTYTKYLIGRKISKNTAKYTQEEIEDGIFFVKSSGVLRIITKWVEQLMEYFQQPEQKIKNSYSESKDHTGRMLYISALLKNGLYKHIIRQKKTLMEKIASIKAECYRMEMLLTDDYFITDRTQIHLSEEQISVGMYCSNLKSAISSYICSQLNELIHHLLKLPREINEEELGSELEDFKNQARKDLDSLNLLSFKLFDLLRCKIHSNEEEVLWIVQYLLAQNKTNKDRFNIIRIKDRLNLGTRDIMINAQINKGLPCEIQLSVTSNTDKKQELLDQYNHFLYELKRSKLGPITENVSIWSTLEQRFSHFDQLMKDKSRLERSKRTREDHQCGNEKFHVFNRPIICKCCNNFFAIPQTCLLNVACQTCKTTLCGECFYYSYLSENERKLFIFDRYKLFKSDVLGRLREYTDYSKPLPATGFFIKKKFLKKQLSFYMAIEKDKNDKIKDAPSIEVIIIQTIIRNDQIVNRQLNKRDIEARLEKGEFYIKDYEKTELNSYIIFYFDKKETKKLMTLKDLETELHKPEHQRTKVLSIVREPSYIAKLHPMKKESEKTRQLNALKRVVKDDKITVYMFNNFFVLAQACVKGSVLRAEIIKKVNTSALKVFAEKETDTVMLEHKKMTTEIEDLSVKMKPALYQMFCHNIKKLFLANGGISSIKCFAKFVNLEFVVISENSLTSLDGIEKLNNLVSFRFDGNQVDNLLPFQDLTSMRYISGNCNQIKSLKGLENLKELRSLSLYENSISSVQEIRDLTTLEELYLRQNPIEDLQAVQTLTNIRKLFIGNTKIKTVPDLAGLTHLESVSLECLNLSEIPDVFGGVKLAELYLAFNSIARITHLERQTDLITLNLGYNKITAIQNLESLDKLETLKLKNNNIKVVRGVKDLDSLKHLNLKNNPIDDIDELSRFEITFKYDFTPDFLSEAAKKQLVEVQTLKENTSQGED